jgi:hypothetical protein
MSERSWQAVCAVNTAKACVPFQTQLRALRRRYRPPRTGPQHESVVSGAADHIAALEAAGLELRGARILELGSGWFPILPLILRAAGAAHVHVTDVHRLADGATLAEAGRFVEARAAQIARRLGIPEEDVRRVASAARGPGGFETRLAAAGLSYTAPFDARDVPPVDAVVSQTVFEHIPPHVLEELLASLAQGLPKGAVMSHGIDNTDHRANADRRLSRFDFLRYSDAAWRLLCLNPQDYTNRLRHSDYMRLFEATGFDPVPYKSHVSRRALDAPVMAKLAPRFAGKAPEDLVTAWSHIRAVRL